MFARVGSGRVTIVELMSLVKPDQLVLWKFHLLTAFPSVGWTGDGVVISDGRCWDR